MRNVLFVNDNSDQPNWGAQATPYAIRAMTKDLLPSAQVEWLPYAWLGHRFQQLRGPWPIELTRPLPKVPGMARLAKPSDPYPEIVDRFDACAKRWLNGDAGQPAAQYLRAAERADLVAFNIENSMYWNKVAGMRALFLMWLAKEHLGKRTAAINMTAGFAGMPRPMMAGMAKRVLPTLDLVTAREPQSLRELHAIGAKNAELAADVVFYLDPTREPRGGFDAWAQRSRSAPYFCLSASAIPMDAPSSDRDGAVTELVRKLKASGLQAVLMARDPHCQFLADVARRTDSIFFGPEHSFHEIWPLLKDAQFLVSGHYHYAIMGAMVGCPFVPFTTNNHKIAGMAEQLDWIHSECVDATALSVHTPAIVAACEKLVRERPKHAEHLTRRAAELRPRAAHSIVRIKGILGA